MARAGRTLAFGAPLILYGPSRRAGVPTAPSNGAFDASLKAKLSIHFTRILAGVDSVDQGRERHS